MDPYEILGLDRSATTEEIRATYIKAAKRHHPDTPKGNAEQFKKIEQAYVILSDPEKKAQFDEHGITGPQPTDEQIVEQMFPILMDQLTQIVLMNPNVDMTTQNPLQLIFDLVKGKRAELENNVVLLEGFLEKAQNMLSRIKKNHDGPSPLIDAIRGHTAAIRQDIYATKAALRANATMLDYLKKYQYTITQMLPDLSFMAGGATSGGSTFFHF